MQPARLKRAKPKRTTDAFNSVKKMKKGVTMVAISVGRKRVFVDINHAVSAYGESVKNGGDLEDFTNRLSKFGYEIDEEIAKRQARRAVEKIAERIRKQRNLSDDAIVKVPALAGETGKRGRKPQELNEDVFNTLMDDLDIEVVA